MPSHDARFECRLMIAIAVFPWNDSLELRSNDHPSGHSHPLVSLAQRTMNWSTTGRFGRESLAFSRLSEPASVHQISVYDAAHLEAAERLQENGYLVLRYLAEDLAKELDSVLDGILRSLSARRKSGRHGHSDHRCAREPRLSRVRSLTGALASAGGHGTPR